MRKKQLLATLVMLSLMQGSVYAAPPTITQDDFTDNVYTATESPIGSINISGASGEQYTLNMEEGRDIIEIIPTSDDGCAVSIGSTSTDSLNSLTIEGSVSIGNKDNPTILTGNLINFNNSDYKQKGANFTIDGNLIIENIDGTQDNTNIIVVRGVNSSAQTASSFKVGDIKINNVHTEGKYSSYDGVLRANGTDSDYPVKIEANNFDLSNSSSYYGIYSDRAEVKLNDVNYKNVELNYGIRSEGSTDATFGSITAEDSNFKAGFIYVNGRSEFSSGEIKAIAAENNRQSMEDASGTNYFIKSDGVKSFSSGNITIDKLDYGTGIIFVRDLPNSGENEASFNIGNINITDSSLGYRTQTAVVYFESDGDDKLTLGDVKLSNITYAETGNNTYGITFDDFHEATIGNITIDGITHKGDYTSSGSNASGGVRFSSTDVTNTIELISVKNIIAKGENNKLDYYGLNFYGGNNKLNTQNIVIDNIQTKAENGSAYGISNGGLLGYQNIDIKNISSGDEAAGIQLADKGIFSPTNDAVETIISVDNVTGSTNAYGIQGTGAETNTLIGNQLNVKNITATSGAVYGINTGGQLKLDAIDIQTVSGGSEAYGIRITDKSNFTENTNVLLSDIKTTESDSKVYGLYVVGNSDSPVLNGGTVTAENIGNTNAGESYGIYNKGRAWIGNGLSINNVLAAEDATAIGFYNHSDTTVAETSQNTLSISNVSGGEVHGLKNYGRSEESNAELETSQISIDGVTGTTSAYGIHNTGYSTFASESDASTRVANPEEDPSLADSAWVYVHDVKATNGEAYGIYTDSEMKNAYTSNVNVVDGVHGATEAHGYKAFEDDVKASAISVNDVDTTKGNAYGIYFDKSSLKSPDGSLIELSATNIDAVGGEAKGIYFGNRNTSLGKTATINVDTVSSTTGSAIGIHIDNRGLGAKIDITNSEAIVVNNVSGQAQTTGFLSDGNDNTISTKTFKVTNITGTTKTYGINVNGDLTVTGNSLSDDSFEGLYIDKVTGTTSATGLKTANDSKLNVGLVSISNISGTDKYANVKGLDACATTSEFNGIVNINNIESGNFAYGISQTTVGSTANYKDSVFVTGVKSENTTMGGAYGLEIDNQTSFAKDLHVSDISSGYNAYGVFGDDTSSISAASTSVSDVSGKTAIGILSTGISDEAFTVSELASVSGIEGSNTAVAIAVESGKADFGAINIFDVKSENGRIALVSAKDGADVSIGSGLITHEDFEDTYTPSYTGNYEGNADSDKNFINSIALRSVGGSTITLGSAASTFADGDNTTADGVFTVVGDIVAGRGDDNADAGSIEINGNNGTRIYGDVYAGNGGEINITLNGEGSILEGQVDDYHEITSENHQVFHNSAFTDDEGNELEVSSAGKATLNINDGGKWIARGQSFVDTVSLNKGVIDMSENENSSVTIKNLNGSGGKFVMNLNTAERDKSDMLYVTGSIEDGGNYEIEIVGDNFDINDITENNPLRFATVKGDVNTDNMKARTTDAGFFNNEYTVTQEDYMDGDAENLIYNGNGNGQGSYKPGNTGVELAFDENDTNLLIGAVSKQTVSDAGQTIINMSRANYSNAIYMDRLNKRMGEARYINPEDEQGMWVRLRHDRIGKEDAFRSQNTMYEMGYNVKQDCDNGDRRVGFAIDYMDGKTEYRNVAGDGDIKRYGLWLYDTWMGDKGHYADYVLKWGHLENDFDIYNSRGKVNGDYSNNVFSVSAEYGKKNDMGNDWYFEPQAQLQLARVTGADYVTSQNTKVSLDGINSLIGRAGFRLGKDMGERSTVYVKADVLHEFLGDQTISALDTTTNGTYCETFENKGTWYDVGFGFATALGKDSYAFMDFEKSFGNDNDETYQINAGVQWTF